MSAPVARSRPHTRWPLAAVFGLVGAIAVAVVVLAFAWPAATAKARDLPIGISGPSSQVDPLRATLEKMDPDPFDLRPVDSRADAVHRIRDRELYGAILLGDHPEVLTSSAASAASNQALRGIASSLDQRISAAAIAALQQRLQQLSSGAGSSGAGSSGAGSSGAGSPGGSGSSGGSTSSTGAPTVTVSDVVPLSDDDPTGAGLNAASFPIALGGMLGGILISLLVVGVIRRLVALLVYGVGAGVLVALVLQTTLHALQGDWGVNALALGVAMLATGAVVVGFNALIGPPGIAVGAILTILVGNPISGAAVPYTFLVAPWGVLGQYLVPGAAASLVRSLSYFPDADPTPQWITLGVWAGAGVLFAIAGHFRSRAPITLPDGELEPEEHARHAA